MYCTVSSGKVLLPGPMTRGAATGAVEAVAWVWGKRMLSLTSDVSCSMCLLWLGAGMDFSFLLVSWRQAGRPPSDAGKRVALKWPS